MRLKDAPNWEDMTEAVILEVAAVKCLSCAGNGKVLQLGEWVTCVICNGRGIIVGSRR